MPSQPHGSDSNPTIKLIGPAVTKEDAEKVGDEMVHLLDAVAESMGLPTGLWTRTGVQVCCDSCDARRPWDDEGHGWVHTADGLDYCIDCIITKPGS